MSRKKIRGKRSKLFSLMRRITDLTEDFPDSDHQYWHMHLPTLQGFIDSSKTPKSIRQKCIQYLIDRTDYLISKKPEHNRFSKVVTVISLPTLWDSQIVVFFDEYNFKSFFIRNNPEQTWIPIPDSSYFIREWHLQIPERLSVKGFQEIINDDFYYEGQIWIIGEL